jgi:hypothetical protein
MMTKNAPDRLLRLNVGVPPTKPGELLTGLRCVYGQVRGGRDGAARVLDRKAE